MVALVFLELRWYGELDNLFSIVVHTQPSRGNLTASNTFNLDSFATSAFDYKWKELCYFVSLTFCKVFCAVSYTTQLHLNLAVAPSAAHRLVSALTSSRSRHKLCFSTVLQITCTALQPLEPLLVRALDSTHS